MIIECGVKDADHKNHADYKREIEKSNWSDEIASEIIRISRLRGLKQ